MFKTLDDVKDYISKTLKKHSKNFVTSNYTVRYSNRQRRTLATTRTFISMGKPFKIEFVFNNKYINTYDINEENIKDTVLHEIAHAIVGYKHGHDKTWVACCHEIGCMGTRTKKINRR